jgi:2-acylglycerol O-acyltransferase 2
MGISLGYIVFNTLYLFIISVNLFLLAGLWLYPFQVGLYVLLPYVSYTKILSAAEFRGEGARWESFTRDFFILNMMRKHLSLNIQPLPDLLVKAEKAPNSQFLIATFPHGPNPDYRVAMDGELKKVFPNIHDKISVLAASVLFMIPIVREMAIWTGCINAKRSVAEKALKKGCSIFVLPGGEAEQIRSMYQKERVYLKNRKGFVKLAMRNNVPVVPSYVFGASDYYYTSNAFFKIRQWLQKSFGICIPLAVGMFGSAFCPLPVKTTIVYGEPLTFQMKEMGSPTSEELNKAHDDFCMALKHLFDFHKKKLGYFDRELEIL